MSSFEHAGSLLLVLLLVGACAAPPTPQQATSQAVKRNCEARGEAAAEEVRRHSSIPVGEDGSASGSANEHIEARASEARERAFKNCMLEYAL